MAIGNWKYRKKQLRTIFSSKLTIWVLNACIYTILYSLREKALHSEFCPRKRQFKVNYDHFCELYQPKVVSILKRPGKNLNIWQIKIISYLPNE